MGIIPPIGVTTIFRDCKFDSKPTLSGIVPVTLHESMDIRVKVVNEPIDVGIIPDNPVEDVQEILVISPWSHETPAQPEEHGSADSSLQSQLGPLSPAPPPHSARLTATHYETYRRQHSTSKIAKLV